MQGTRARTAVRKTDKATYACNICARRNEACEAMKGLPEAHTKVEMYRGVNTFRAYAGMRGMELSVPVFPAETWRGEATRRGKTERYDTRGH